MKIIFLGFDGVMDTAYYDRIHVKKRLPERDMYVLESKNKSIIHNKEVAPDTDEGQREMKRIIGFSFLIIIALLTTASCQDEAICPDDNHPHLIDLGLPDGTMWSCCNVGAHSPDQIGGYYAWGETNVKSVYEEETYQHSNLSHMIPQRMGNIAGSEYDVAYKNMGASWQMPTAEQWQELISYCEWKWVSFKGRHGWKITGSSNNAIFLPAGGAKGGGTCFDKDEHLYYWTSDYNYEGDINNYQKFYDNGPQSFHSNGAARDTGPAYNYQYCGFNVRPIRKN